MFRKVFEISPDISAQVARDALIAAFTSSSCSSIIESRSTMDPDLIERSLSSW